MFERRSIRRTKAATAAKVFFNGSENAAICLVKDLTHAGAQLQISDLSVFPLQFDFSFDNFRTIRNCLVIWSRRDILGVRFTENGN